MKIILNANYSYTINNSRQETQVVKKEAIKKLFTEILKEKGEYESSKITWKDDEDLKISNISTEAINTFMEKAEKLGKSIRYIKKTIIEII